MKTFRYISIVAVCAVASAAHAQYLNSFGSFSSSQAGFIESNGWIVGNGTDASGAVHQVVWTPVPEPASFIALGLACALLRRKARN